MSKSSRFSQLPPHGGGEPYIRVFQLHPSGIQELTAHVEACDNLGLVRTLDERRGLVECWIMPDFEGEFLRVLEGIGRTWPMQEIDPEFE